VSTPGSDKNKKAQGGATGDQNREGKKVPREKRGENSNLNRGRPKEKWQELGLKREKTVAGRIKSALRKRPEHRREKVSVLKGTRTAVKKGERTPETEGANRKLFESKKRLPAF